MDFRDAMDALKSGSKVTREKWLEKVYFLFDGKQVKSYQPMLSAFIYNEDIMISDGWLLADDNEDFFHMKEYSFSEIIPFIYQGRRAKLNEWKEQYIYFDNSIKALALHTMEILQFMPQFEDFLANDWMEI